ncbi:MAG: hypothetical protein ACM3SY_04195 [Candidatus Omnitrophota bacterium]
MAGTKSNPSRKPTKINVWKCEDLKALINEKIRAEVKDAQIVERLERLMSDEIAYGTGGSGGVGVA